LYTYYGTVDEANTYFDNRLFSTTWTSANATEREQALIGATQIIDRLNFSGEKAAVYAILYDSDGDLVDPAPTKAEIRAAYLSQELEFPRGTDTNVPDDIKIACWEVAYALLDGIDPDMEAENLAVIGQTISSVRTTYDRNNVSMEHIANGVPSAKAWRLLRPFLRDSHLFKMSRVT